MQSLKCVLLLIISVQASRYHFADPNMPIRVVDTSTGKDSLMRLDYVEAEILPRHLKRRTRVIFPERGSGERWYEAIRAHGDEHGHLVAAGFSGPVKWYNLTPQSPIVNRNENGQAVSIEWHRTECDAREWLQRGDDHKVIWKVSMSYIGDSNRPDQYHLQVSLLPDGPQIDTRIDNLLLSQQNYWVNCHTCFSRRCRRH